MNCKHRRGDWITEMAYWLCADCWLKMEKRPTEYNRVSPVRGADGKWTGPLQQVSWQAEIAQADGLTLNDFLRTMARRYIRRTRPPMDLGDAYDAGIDLLKSLGDSYGDPAYSWDAGGAREFADDDMQNWDYADGNE